MKSAWHDGRLGGGDSSPHWSFLIVLFWVALTSLAAGAALALAVNAAFLIFAIFACVNLLFMALAAFLAKRREAPGATHIVPATPANSPAKSPSSVLVDEDPSFIVLPAHARAKDMTRVLFARQSYFPVAQGGEVVGVISKGRLMSALADGQGDCLIAELMNHASRARLAPAKQQKRACQW